VASGQRARPGCAAPAHDHRRAETRQVLARHAIETLNDASLRDDLAIRVDHAFVVLALMAQSMPTKIIEPLCSLGIETEEPSSTLMDQGSLARHPTSHLGFLATGRGHDLSLELALSNGEVLTHRRLGPCLAHETVTKPLATDNSVAKAGDCRVATPLGARGTTVFH
jgi:hypothetical protein